MLEIVTGVDIRYQGLFVRMRMSEMRALAAKGGHKGPTLVMLAAFIRIEARSCRMQNVEFPRFLPSSRASRPLERLSQRPADLWESVPVWL